MRATGPVFFADDAPTKTGAMKREAGEGRMPVVRRL